MRAEINYESLSLLGKYALIMLGLLALVWVIALLTPKAAALIDKMRGKDGNDGTDEKSPERVQDSIDTDNNENTEYKVYSAFEDRPRGAVNGYEKENTDNGKGK